MRYKKLIFIPYKVYYPGNNDGLLKKLPETCTMNDHYLTYIAQVMFLMDDFCKLLECSSRTPGWPDKDQIYYRCFLSLQQNSQHDGSQKIDQNLGLTRQKIYSG